MRATWDRAKARIEVTQPSPQVAAYADVLGIKRTRSQRLRFPELKIVVCQLAGRGVQMPPELLTPDPYVLLQEDRWVPGLRSDQKSHVRYHLAASRVRTRQKQRVRALLANSTGVGKTVEMLQLLRMTEPKRALIVPTLGARQVYRSEIPKWLPEAEQIGDDLWEVPWGHIAVRHYENLQVNARNLPRVDFLAFDEAHRLTSRKRYTQKTAKALENGQEIPKSERDKSRVQICMDVAKRAEHVVCMTATPARNRGHDVWGVLRFIDPSLYTGFWTYVRAYYHVTPTRYGSYDIGELAYPEHADAEIAQWRTCSTRGEIFPDLGYETQVVPASLTGDWRVLYKQRLYSHFSEWFQDPISKRHWLAQYTLSPRLVGYDDAPLAQGKIGMCADLMRDTDERVVVFCCYVKAIKLLAQYARGRSLTGADSGRVREEIVKAFHAGTHQHLYVQPRAGGEGIDLSCADRGIFLDLDPAPSTIEQNIGRLVRPARLERASQPNHVLFQIAEVPGTHDQYLREMVVDKTRELVNLNSLTGAQEMFDELRKERDECQR